MTAMGSIQGVRRIQDFRAKKGLGADVEVIPMRKINEAFKRMLKNDVRYRFVIDLASLKS